MALHRNAEGGFFSAKNILCSALRFDVRDYHSRVLIGAKEGLVVAPAGVARSPPALGDERPNRSLTTQVGVKKAKRMGTWHIANSACFCTLLSDQFAKPSARQSAEHWKDNCWGKRSCTCGSVVVVVK
jgi:hypothetical protein